MDDLVGGMALFKKGADDRRHLLCLGDGQIDTFPGIHQFLPVFFMCSMRVIIILVEPALRVAPAAIACPGGAVPACAGELQVGGA